MIRVLVCGTNYGRVYADALAAASDRYRLAGFLARGSRRSLQAAAQHGVPLYRSVEDIAPGSIDVACAAVGRAAEDVILALLVRGVPVLCEHPRDRFFVDAALQAAADGGARFHVNAHFGDLEGPRTFAQRLAGETRSSPPLWLHAHTSDRYLYATLDVLARALPRLDAAGFRGAGGRHPFRRVEGRLGGTGAVLEVQGAGTPEGDELQDGSADYQVSMRITAGLPAGTLSLLSVSGPVVWNARESRAMAPDAPLWVACGEASDVTSRGLRAQRRAANLGAVDALMKDVRDGVRPAEQDPDRLRDVSSAWDAAGRAATI